ncbi:hypothetical protein GGS20DRAFT_535789, partial [Poronia punctata]
MMTIHAGASCRGRVSLQSMESLGSRTDYKYDLVYSNAFLVTVFILAILLLVSVFSSGMGIPVCALCGIVPCAFYFLVFYINITSGFLYVIPSML